MLIVEPMYGTASFPELRIPSELAFSTRLAQPPADPEVSVVIPVHNRPDSLRNAVSSVLALDEGPCEILVVDDGSSDSGAAVVEQMSPKVSVIRIDQRSGANTARNMGIAFARATFVSFLDSDDFYLPGRLSMPLQALKSGRANVVLSGFTTKKNNKTTLVKPAPGVYGQAEFRHKVAGYSLPVGTSGLTIRRDVLIKCGGFDPSVARMQDRDIMLRLSQYSCAEVLQEALWCKNWSTDGISTPLETYYDAFYTLTQKHPIFASEELPTRNYLIFRHLIQLLKSGRMDLFTKVYQHANRHMQPPLPGMVKLLRNYLDVRGQRRKDRNAPAAAPQINGTG